MCITIFTADYIDLNNCRNTEKNEINIKFKYLLLSIAISMLLLCPISLVIYTMIKPLITNKSYGKKLCTQIILYAVKYAGRVHPGKVYI